MTLESGTRLGPYEIVSLLGKGGMGEVYRARDTHLEREVAIKVLPPAFTADADRLARFEREAKVLASLNNPQIGQIYGLEDIEGGHALVLELVDGPTLAERIEDGPIPVEEALEIAKQITKALEAAHEQGIIHRDLKPANIKVRPDGTVKVLDFGLAKAVDTRSEGSPSESPTLTLAATQMGAIMGTAAYMSPEQARGKPVDQQADVWSFGVVLLEMLTGHGAFEGDDISLTLSLVLQQEPDWTGLPAGLPPSVSAFLRRCLVKDTRQRLHDIGDMRLALEGAFETKTAVPGEASEIRALRLWQRPAPAAVALLLAATLGGLAVWISMQAGRVSRIAALPDLSLTIVPPRFAPLRPMGALSTAPEISPDGSSVLFTSGLGGHYVRRLDSHDVLKVPGSGRAAGGAFWSADSTSVFFPTRAEGLVRVRMPDGAPEVAMALPSFTRGGSANEAAAILISSGSRLRLLAASGGEVETLDFEALGAGQALYPEFLPDGENFLFLFVSSDRAESEVYLASLAEADAHSPVLLMTNETAVRYTPSGGGQLLFVRDDTLYTRRLDLKQRTLVGESRAIEERVGSALGTVKAATFSIARSGLVAWRSGTAALNQITSYRRDGSVAATTGLPTDAASLRLSPDETRLLAIGADRTWLLDVGRPGQLDLGFGVSWRFWSRGGSHLVGASDDSDGRGGGVLVERAVAGGEVRELGGYQGIPQDLSPDGSQVVLMDGSRGIVQNTESSQDADRRELFVEGGSSGYSFSPDGRWVVYLAPTGVFVQPFPGPGLRRQIADLPGAPRWRGDGREIIFRHREDVYSIGVTKAGDDLVFGEPVRLFSGLRRPAGTNRSTRPMAVSHDGSLIYWPQPAEQPGSDVIHIRTNAVD